MERRARQRTRPRTGRERTPLKEKEGKLAQFASFKDNDRDVMDISTIDNIMNIQAAAQKCAWKRGRGTASGQEHGAQPKGLPEELSLQLGG